MAQGDPAAAILFVCLGNICRSPLAEGAMRAEAERAGLTVVTDSAGTAAYHVGKMPDPRARATAKANGTSIEDLRARQVSAEDFRRFSHIYAMDDANLKALEAIRPDDATASLSLLLDVVAGRQGESIADPYYGDGELFTQTWNDVSMAARAIVAAHSE